MRGDFISIKTLKAKLNQIQMKKNFYYEICPSATRNLLRIKGICNKIIYRSNSKVQQAKHTYSKREEMYCSAKKTVSRSKHTQESNYRKICKTRGKESITTVIFYIKPKSSTHNLHCGDIYNVILTCRHRIEKIPPHTVTYH